MNIYSFAIGDEVATPSNQLTLVTGTVMTRTGLRYRVDGSISVSYSFEELRLVRRATETTIDVAMRMILGTGPSISTMRLKLERESSPQSTEL